MAGKRSIISVSVDDIAPHPDNPRRDMGDLSELAESIRKNGVMQNLTLVANPGYEPGAATEAGRAIFWAVVGNRRLAAARLAGLREVPAAVAIMDSTEQLATMLAENLLRADLTPWEQACGIQTMLDLGETVRTVAKRTGFSETTVRARAELAKLPGEKVVQKQSEGATLFDFMKLSAVKDPARREGLLDSIGTGSFSWKLEDAVKEERVEGRKDRALEAARGFADPLPEGNTRWAYERLAKYDLSAEKEPKITAPDHEGRPYYDFDEYRGSIYILAREKTGTPVSTTTKTPAQIAKTEDFRRRKEALEALDGRYRRKRALFVRDMEEKRLKGDMDALFKAVAFVLDSEGVYFSDEAYADARGGPGQPLGDIHKPGSPIVGAIELFRILYACCEYKGVTPYGMRTWKEEIDPPDPESDDNGGVTVYGFLGRFGYEPDAEERSYLDGTHGLYAPSPAAGDGGTYGDCREDADDAEGEAAV